MSIEYLGLLPFIPMGLFVLFLLAALIASIFKKVNLALVCAAGLLASAAAFFVCIEVVESMNLPLIGGDTSDTTVATTVAEEDIVLDVSFADIYYDYKKNELAADDIYKNNRYRITAEINGIKTGGLLNATGGATLTMEIKVDNTIVYFLAEFEKEQEEALKKVAVGDTITFEGTCLSAGSWIDCEMVG